MFFRMFRISHENKPGLRRGHLAPEASIRDYSDLLFQVYRGKHKTMLTKAVMCLNRGYWERVNPFPRTKKSIRRDINSSELTQQRIDSLKEAPHRVLFYLCPSKTKRGEPNSIDFHIHSSTRFPLHMQTTTISSAHILYACTPPRRLYFLKSPLLCLSTSLDLATSPHARCTQPQDPNPRVRRTHFMNDAYTGLGRERRSPKRHHVSDGYFPLVKCRLMYIEDVMRNGGVVNASGVLVGCSRVREE
ncbi:hypothetical protein P171DRAFT_13384 [Karstenula rhodostoma CBS 690.94]|uniref:Uncharacterized protein n=1 Tax=Karstenula rhodostoma CBS 690.94 TaxID=1392251 RepID=A0A9P4UJ52_9PLEO|nr:hypothetical protein P171DRAFT_13384 [Karstenula rhodostoma CBS 690.94]